MESFNSLVKFAICSFFLNHENFPYYGQIRKKAIKTDSICIHLPIIIEGDEKAEWKIFAFSENSITVCNGYELPKGSVACLWLT
jgi:hypothetical protein